VRLYSRPGNDLTYRFPLIVESLARPRSRSCVIDGEAVACDESGVPSAPAIEDGHHSRKHGCCDHGVAFARQMDKAANPSFRRGRPTGDVLHNLLSKSACAADLPSGRTYLSWSARNCLPSWRAVSAFLSEQSFGYAHARNDRAAIRALASSDTSSRPRSRRAMTITNRSEPNQKGSKPLPFARLNHFADLGDRSKLPFASEDRHSETAHPFGAYLTISGDELAADLRAGFAKALDEPNVFE
jgi:hypothetical protein